jgi:hypothetical protein
MFLVNKGNYMESTLNVLHALIIVLLLLTQACGSGGSSDDPTPQPEINEESGNDTTEGEDSSEESLDGGYSGSESQASITADNAKDLGVAAASGAKQAIIEDQLVYPGRDETQTASSQPHSDYTPSAVPEITEELNQETTADLCPHGGLAEYESVEETADSFISVLIFTDCQYGEGLFRYSFTGSIRSTDPKDSNMFPFIHVSDGVITGVDGIPREVHQITDCDESYEYLCVFSFDFSGYDDRIYRLTDISVTGDGDTAYTVSGRIYDPAHGYIEVTTEVPFTLECPGEHPGVGRLSFTGANETSGSIEYISCDEYVISTSDGVSTTYQW